MDKSFCWKRVVHSWVGDTTLRETVIKTERGFLVKPLAKLFDSLLSSAGLENCNPVHCPGVRSESSLVQLNTVSTERL